MLPLQSKRGGCHHGHGGVPDLRRAASADDAETVPTRARSARTHSLDDTKRIFLARPAYQQQRTAASDSDSIPRHHHRHASTTHTRPSARRPPHTDDDIRSLRHRACLTVPPLLPLHDQRPHGLVNRPPCFSRPREVDQPAPSAPLAAPPPCRRRRRGQLYRLAARCNGPTAISMAAHRLMLMLARPAICRPLAKKSRRPLAA